MQDTLWRRKTLKVAKQITSKQNWKISANAHCGLAALLLQLQICTLYMLLHQRTTCYMLHNHKYIYGKISVVVSAHQKHNSIVFFKMLRRQRKNLRNTHVTESEKYLVRNQRNTCCRIWEINVTESETLCTCKWSCRWIICASASQIQVVHCKSDPTERGWRAERNSSDGVLSLFSDTRICGNRAPGCVTTHASRGFGGNCVMRASTNRCVKIGGGSNTRLMGATSLFSSFVNAKELKKEMKRICQNWWGQQH